MRKAGFWGKIGLVFRRLRPSLFKPVPALELGLTDPTCGLNMGQTAEVLAKEFAINARIELDIVAAKQLAAPYALARKTRTHLKARANRGSIRP